MSTNHKREPKQIRTEVLPLTSLTPYRYSTMEKEDYMRKEKKIRRCRTHSLAAETCVLCVRKPFRSNW